MDITDNLILSSPGAGLDIDVTFDFDRVGGTIQGNDIRTRPVTASRIHGHGANGLGELHITANRPRPATTATA